MLNKIEKLTIVIALGLLIWAVVGEIDYRMEIKEKLFLHEVYESYCEYFPETYLISMDVKYSINDVRCYVTYKWDYDDNEADYMSAYYKDNWKSFLKR